MSFPYYPDHAYGCPHVGHCPHVGGASLGTLVYMAEENTQWHEALLRQLDELREANAAKAQEIEKLRREVEELKRELKTERQKQFKAKKDSAGEPPMAVAVAAEKAGKKRGAPVGHPGWFRPRPDHFDRLILVPAPSECPHCQGRVKARPDLPP